jgi:enoyl-CoA hydratase/carnithine racemase
MTDNLALSAAEHVAVIEITRPPTNYIDRQLIGEIVDAAAQFSAAGSRAIVLCSRGKHFCAGANLGDSEFGSNRVRASESLYGEAIRLFDIAIPIIAAVQGAAVGGGVGLACAADFRIATPSTRFHANFSMLGFHHGFGLSATLPSSVPSRPKICCTPAGVSMGSAPHRSVLLTGS